MKKRQFAFDGAEGVADKMAEILNHYAEAAYPLGGSDCAAASRQALQELATNIIQAELNNEVAMLNKRQRPVLKAAATWYFSELENNECALKDNLLSQLETRKR